MTNRLDSHSLLWMLFADLNSRFNTLIEECAHLQDTIFSLISDRASIDKLIKDATPETGIPGFKRPTYIPLPRGKPDSQYYLIPQRDRAFLNLWNTLGGLIKGLSRNQATHRLTYERTLALTSAKASSEPLRNTEDLYWYLSLRAYLLQRVFAHYTEQLEHAHEKLVQMLESQPGALPQPILLRRWNSAAYGEFLSEYSRHVNWETYTAIQAIQKKDPGYKEAPAPDAFTHTWTHQPTSLTSTYDVDIDSACGDKKAKRFSVIRSAYFYLEQPVLLPLLYHECAHINFPNNDALASCKLSFFGRRLELNRSLWLAKFPTGNPEYSYDNFWDHYTEEVWSDAISLALNGRSYLLALALQLFGKSGETAFNHFKIEDDILYELSRLGTPDHRKYEASYPELTIEYFWEARIGIACDLMLHLCKARSGRKGTASNVELDRNLALAVDSLLDHWVESGKHAYSSEGTSSRHAECWRDRHELNLWVRTESRRYILDGITELSKLDQVSLGYTFNGIETADWISRCFNSYRNSHIRTGDLSPDAFTLSQPFRLENVAVDIRSVIAIDVTRTIGEVADGKFSGWTSGFANWMRSDGGVAFRIALEFSRVRRSILDALADQLDCGEHTTDSPFDPYPHGWVAKRISFLAAEVRKRPDYQPDKLADLLRRRKLFNISDPGEGAKYSQWLLTEIDLLADSVVTDSTKDSCRNDQREISVGTLSFGSIKPADFASRYNCNGSSGSPYNSTVASAEAIQSDAIVEQCKLANATTRNLDSARDDCRFQGFFLPLVGEYNYLSYIAGTTPVERDVHTNDTAPRSTNKPRLVIFAGGTPIEHSFNTYKHASYARVSLIRFRYRWQWQDLLRELRNQTGKKSPFQAFSLYLSSGWEDVILVTWHAKPEQTWELDDFGLNFGQGCVDVQSSYYVPQGLVQVVELPLRNPVDHWGKALTRWAENTGLVSAVNERSGRYDFTVVWEDARGRLNPLTACAKGLAMFPRKLWAGVASTITSYERQRFPAPTTRCSRRRHTDITSISPRRARRHISPQKYKAVTHFALRDSPRKYSE